MPADSTPWEVRVQQNHMSHTEDSVKRRRPRGRRMNPALSTNHKENQDGTNLPLDIFKKTVYVLFRLCAPFLPLSHATGIPTSTTGPHPNAHNAAAPISPASKMLSPKIPTYLHVLYVSSLKHMSSFLPPFTSPVHLSPPPTGASPLNAASMPPLSPMRHLGRGRTARESRYQTRLAWIRRGPQRPQSRRAGIS